ncbi:MAG TPA: response regulator [Polyangiaceae bacterium]|nr:response regulator [Polyangiaceae bacterium]
MTSVALAGRLEPAHLEERCCDLNQIVARAKSAILQAAAGGVSVQLSLSPNAARVALSSEELERIVIGLCDVACSALGPGGRLIVETRGLNDAQVGSAPGLASTADARARVVVRTEQPRGPAECVAPSPRRSDQLLAFGELEALLERLGGRLERARLSDTDLAYVAHLPYVAPGSSSGRMPVALAQGAEVILLIEDEPQVQAVTARILRAFGYAVITAHNERTAMAQAEQYGAAIALVVSDLVLPGVSGTDLVRRLRQPCEHARVLYMSGYSPEHVGALVEDASFLHKPFTADELVTRVRDLLAPPVH